MENNEIIMDEVMVDEVVEAAVEPAGVDFGKIGLGILVAGAVVALGYQAYRFVKAKKDAKKARELAEDDSVIEVEDFEAVEPNK